nr:hypothetical protein [Tanacetum cinerariifolium]
MIKEEHEMNLGLILELLNKEKLYVKFSKCEFWLQEVQFFGHVINGDGLHVDSSKIEAVKNWEVHRPPLEGKKQERAFLTMKDKLCNAHVLALPDRPEDFIVYYDVSGLGLGYVLMQRGKVIAYASRQLKSTPTEMLQGLDDQMKHRSDGPSHQLPPIITVDLHLTKKMMMRMMVLLVLVPHLLPPT